MSLDVYLECTCCEDVLYDANITHNLGKIAEEAGIYQALWRPDECGISTANQLVPILEPGLAYLREHIDELRTLEPDNGWGTVENLIDFTQNYLRAAHHYGETIVKVWR